MTEQTPRSTEHISTADTQNTKVASAFWQIIFLKNYTVFQKNGHPFYFFHNSLKWWSIYTKFLPDVAEQMLIQNIWTKYGC